MANRKATVARTDDEIVDRRPLVPGIYRRVLGTVCLREAEEARMSRNPGGWLQASDDADELAEWESGVAAEAEQLTGQRLTDRTPIKAKWYDVPKGLPAPLDQLGRDPAPRYLTIYPDDRIDATKWFNGLRRTYERARYFPNCDHGYFQAGFALAGEFGV